MSIPRVLRIMKIFWKIQFGAWASIAMFAPAFVFGASIEVKPENPIQGEPIMISVSATSTVGSIKLDGKQLKTFFYRGRPSAFYGVDLYKKPGTYKMKVLLSDGVSLERDITVSAREKKEEPLGIPEKLGGNTPASATRLVDTLAAENASMLGLRTGKKAFWTENFAYPIADPVVTDGYGYQRRTGNYTIAHKGTDFRAKEGVPVMSMNRGVVRIAREGRNYGKTVIIDHGLGLQTFYMHLSKINVNVGELVQKGQVIGRSGMTGYAERPHLHLTVRIDDVSIDPVKFMDFFK